MIIYRIFRCLKGEKVGCLIASTVNGAELTRMIDRNQRLYPQFDFLVRSEEYVQKQPGPMKYAYYNQGYKK